jgi:hypothetical protein
MHQMSNEEKIQIILDCSFLLVTYKTYIKRIKTSIDDWPCRGETTHRQNKLWQFIANIMIYIKKIYILQILYRCLLHWNVTNHQSVKCKCLYFCALTGFLIDLIKLFYSILFYNMHSARYRMMTLIRSIKR